MSAHQSSHTAPPTFPSGLPNQRGARWSAADIILLRRAWADIAIARADLPQIMGRTPAAIEHMVNILQLGPRPTVTPQPNAWSEADDAILRSKWHTHSRGDIAALVERSPNAVSLRARALKLGPSDYTRMASAQRLEVARQRLIERRKANQVVESVTTAQRRTEGRRDYLVTAWPDGVPIAEIVLEMSEMAGGGPINPTFVRNWTRDLGLSRPAGYTGIRTTAPSVAVWHEPEPAPVPKVARKCLCCGRGFEAPTRFIRLCGPCKGGRD